LEEYARLVISGDETPPEEVEDRVRARMTRQVILEGRPPEVWALIDESALRRRVGSAELMVRQLNHLIAAVESPKLTIQILPLDATTTAGLLGGFIIAESSRYPTTVSIESAGRGEVSADIDLVKPVWRRYDRLRAEACRPVDSIEMIKKVRDRWIE
jgi:hypothetical protein